MGLLGPRTSGVIPSAAPYRAQRNTAVQAAASRSPAVASSTGRPGGLILPGDGHSMPDPRGRGGGGRLILPGRDSGGQPGQPRPQMPQMTEPQATPPTHNPYRPPPGFMEKEQPDAEADDMIEPQEMLRSLRDQSASWHELAGFLTLLARAGYDSAAIEADTGIERVQQNVTLVAGQVYQSLADGEKIGSDVMQFYDTEGSEMLLYELRFLGNDLRITAARYIAEQGLEAPAARVLAKAMKEHVRREGPAFGFSTAPGDSLAYKYYRDAIETRREKEKEQLLQKALEAATTESARTAVANLMQQEPEAEPSLEQPPLQVVRLSGEQSAFRAVPVISALSEASPSSIASVPRARQQGDFNFFFVDQSMAGFPWAVLPAWHSLMVARSPVGLSIPDCSQVPAFVAACKAQTQSDKARLVGQGLLVLDAADKQATDPSHTFE
ncbi:hypothetical protein WJX73_008467 [Symbiochloris irregularis]|uniref:Uncharacterized protein n=1 Tax=Symbiochloris irregularis TaxID=706552 RepID=A0AAW1NLJ3_9CHLO